MQVRADGTSLILGNDAVRWATPYLTSEQLRAAIRLWPPRLRELREEGAALLPYSISDEFVDAFEATLRDAGRVSLRAVVADCIGFDLDEDDPVMVMGRNLPIVERREQPFGEFDRDELIGAVEAMTK